MWESTEKRLSETPEGLALVELVKLCGGMYAFAKRTGCGINSVRNFYNRGKIPQKTAASIARKKWAREAGFTKERIRPDVKVW